MNEQLFRTEALEARRTNWLGQISLAQPLRLWILACLVAVASATVICFLVFGEYTRRSRVMGQLVPDLGLSTVVAPTAGVLFRIFPEEGAEVRVGDALVVINVPRATISGRDTLALIREGMDTRHDSLRQLGKSQVAQIDAQMGGYAHQLAAARRELKQIENEIGTRREQVRLGQETIARYQSVVDQQYVSQIQLSQQQQAVLELVNARQSLERQATSIRRDIAQLEQSLRELPPQREALRATTRRDMATLDQERIQQETSGELLIKAPVSGLIATRLIEPGQAVQVGQPLMSLLPKDSQLQAKLLVPSAAVGFIEPGDRVLLRYRAYPYQKFGHHNGKVIRISRSAVNSVGSATLQDAGATSEPYYQVLVKLDRQSITAYGKSEPLRPGMMLDADILSERRKLYEWVLEPLYSLSGGV